MKSRDYNANKALTETARLRLTPAQQQALERAAQEQAELIKRLGA